MRRRSRRSGRSAPAKGRIIHPPSAPDPWTTFERALIGAIRDLSEDEFLVIQRKDTNYFVQFAAQGSFGLRVEAAANVYQPRPERIPGLEVQHLMQMGWKSPTYVPSNLNQEPIVGSPNFYLDVADPVPYGDISALAVETLRGPFGVRHPGELEYQGFSGGPISIRFPQLGIKRRDSILKSLIPGPLPVRDEATMQIILPAAEAVC